MILKKMSRSLSRKWASSSPTSRASSLARAILDGAMERFATGDATQVRVRLRNGDRHNVRVLAEMGAIEAFALGPAAQTWTRYPRMLLRFVQQFFLTAWMLPLTIFGAVLMLRARRRRELLLLLALPLYYMSVQSILWTEFRYIIAMHYALLLLAALALHWLGLTLWQQARRLRRNAPSHEVR